MRTLLVAVALALLLGLGAVQIGSDALFSHLGAVGSVPAALSTQLGVRIYAEIDRIAPAPYVAQMLAQAALDRGDLGSAQRYAARLPRSTTRDEVLARIAQARGDFASAQRYFIAAGDIVTITAQVDALARRDPAAAYALEMRFMRRLQQSATHPDAVADAYWRLGTLASAQGRQNLAMSEYRRAVRLSPLSDKYLLAAGFQAYDMGNLRAAQGFFARGISVAPGSVDAYAGAGLAALRAGDAAAAQRDAARANATGRHSELLRKLQEKLANHVH